MGSGTKQRKAVKPIIVGPKMLWLLKSISSIAFIKYFVECQESYLGKNLYLEICTLSPLQQALLNKYQKYHLIKPFQLFEMEYQLGQCRFRKTKRNPSPHYKRSHPRFNILKC